MPPSLVLPERTVDTSLAFEFLSAAPTAIMWSPNNNRGAGTVDHEIQGRRRFDIECKTIYADDAGRWVVKIPLTQLLNYLNQGHTRLIYLLPAEPVATIAPWVRHCNQDPNFLGWCTACANPSPTEGAAYSRRWAGREAHYQIAAPEVRMQPWFNHWAWLLSATDLHAFIGAHPTLVVGDAAYIPAADDVLEAIGTSIRLCHWLDAVRRDWVANSPVPAAASVLQDPDSPAPHQEMALDLDAWDLSARPRIEPEGRIRLDDVEGGPLTFSY